MGINGAAVAAPWLAVREASGASWLCARLDTAGTALELVAQGGSGGLGALREHFAENAVSFGVFAFVPGYPYGEGTRKFAFLVCVGAAVNAMKRGKVPLQKNGVYEAFNGGIAADAGIYQGEEEASDAAVLEELRRNMPKATLFV